MISNVPKANFYSIASIETPSSPVAVGGRGVMNEVGRFIKNNNIIVQMGISEDECLLLLNLTPVEVIDIVEKAKVAYDAYVKENAKTDQ